jgi:flagellar transcriptional activator FlhC
MMRGRSVVAEAKQIDLASSLIHLGARLQVLQSETSLSRERLLRLYKRSERQIATRGCYPIPRTGSSPATEHPRVTIHRHLPLSRQTMSPERIDALVRAYRLTSSTCKLLRWTKC